MSDIATTTLLDNTEIKPVETIVGVADDLESMLARFATNSTIDGIIETSVKMMDQTANGELDVTQSKAAALEIRRAFIALRAALTDKAADDDDD